MKHSDSLAKIGPAVVAFQKEITNPANTATNPHFRSKYAPMPDMLNHLRPALAKNGLAVVQGVQTDDAGRAGVVTMLLHVSGEWIESDPVLLKDRQDTAQGAGSAITYARRYSLSAMLAVASEDDDDANAASQSPPQRRPAKPKPPVDDEAAMGEAFEADQKKHLPGTDEEQQAFFALCDKVRKASNREQMEAVAAEARETLPNAELRKKLHALAGAIAAERKREEERDRRGDR